MSDELDQTIAHFGVPGMKWGRRKSRTASSTASETPAEKSAREKRIAEAKAPKTVNVKLAADKKGLQATGGGQHPPSADAVKALSVRQKGKASGMHALTNEEMTLLVKRLNLETSYKKALSENAEYQTKGQKIVSAGKEFLKTLLKSEAEARFKGEESPIEKKVKAAKAMKRGIAAVTVAKKVADVVK